MKNFDGWNERKKCLEDVIENTLIFSTREIWWCALGVNLGREQDGKNTLFERPVLVFKRFNAETAWVLPLSSHIKTGRYYHTLLSAGRQHTASLSQLRLVSAKRFLRFMGQISPQEYDTLRRRIIALINAN